MEEVEIKMLQNGDKCYECKSKLTSFMKYRAGTRFLWSGWCDKCQRDRVTIVGNTPDEEDASAK